MKFSPSRPSHSKIPFANNFNYLISNADVANNECNPTLLHYTELYNSALDHIDLMRDYYIWQNCHHPGQFAYCQYPFILSILAKRFILTKVINILEKCHRLNITNQLFQDCEQQMILNARKSLVAKMTRHRTPQIDIFFLNINVRRSYLVEDSLNEVVILRLYDPFRNKAFANNQSWRRFPTNNKTWKKNWKCRSSENRVSTWAVLPKNGFCYSYARYSTRITVCSRTIGTRSVTGSALTTKMAIYASTIWSEFWWVLPCTIPTFWTCIFHRYAIVNC